MRKIVILVICSTLFFSCKEEPKEKVNEIVKSEARTLAQEENNCLQKKFRLCKKENYFKISKKHIKLKVPIPSNVTGYDGVDNISSSTLNAIMVSFLGNPDCSNDDKPKPKSIPLIKFNDIDMNELTEEDSILVVFFVDENPIQEDVLESFKKIVDSSKTYQEALKKVRKASECNREYIVKPKESDGDVIGGNG